MRYFIISLLPLIAAAQSSYEMLTNYHLAAGDFTAAVRWAAKEPNAERSTELKQAVEVQRQLALQVALAGAERAQAQSDWARMRREVARALSADPGNKQARALAEWMIQRGIVRPLRPTLGRERATAEK